jgi:beta-lactamase class A
MSHKQNPEILRELGWMGIAKKRWLFWSTLVGCLLAGMLIQYAAFGEHRNPTCTSALDLIRPNLDCEISDTKSQQMSKLQNKLEALIPLYIKNGKADKIGVFVRDMKTTRFAGVNDGDTFIMASLLKVPLLITGYKMAEVEPKILDQEIKYTGKPDLYSEQSFPIEDKLIPNNSYTVRELMRRAVVYSDNTASELLAQSYPPNFFDRILKAVGLQIRSHDGNDENLTTPRSYANLFRILYNASYLTGEYSNEALKTLAQTTYRNGAVAKLPPGIAIAHKFAERTVFADKTHTIMFKQLHECGLVYAHAGKSPYTFCIMTEGKDFQDLQQVQQELSLDIYETIAD